MCLELVIGIRGVEGMKFFGGRMRGCGFWMRRGITVGSLETAERVLYLFLTTIPLRESTQIYMYISVAEREAERAAQSLGLLCTMVQAARPGINVMIRRSHANS